LEVDRASAAFTLEDLGSRRVPVALDRAPRFEALGAALARFQAVGEHALESHGVEAELAVLDALAAKVRTLRGALPHGWEAARASLEPSLRLAERAPQVLAHRDLHDEQLLECDGGVALLDFDLLVRADAALDVGNLLAHFELRAMQGHATAEAADRCAAAFRAGYGVAADADLQRIATWGAASFLRLALVYSLRPRYAHLGPRLVDRALSEMRDGAR
jgi:hypothetical protein